MLDIEEGASEKDGDRTNALHQNSRRKQRFSINVMEILEENWELDLSR
jgi:hypothetical protein